MHVFRAPVEAAPRRVVRVARDPELRRQQHLVATLGDRAADEHLVRVRPVHVGGVEHRHAEIERVVDGRDRLGVVGGAVELRHAHAAEPLRGGDETLGAE